MTLIRTQFPDGETRSVIKSASPFKGADFNELLNELIDRGILEVCEVRKSNKQKYEGVRPVREHSGNTQGKQCSPTDTHSLREDAPL